MNQRIKLCSLFSNMNWNQGVRLKRNDTSLGLVGACLCTEINKRAYIMNVLFVRAVITNIINKVVLTIIVSFMDPLCVCVCVF